MRRRWWAWVISVPFLFLFGWRLWLGVPIFLINGSASVQKGLYLALPPLWLQRGTLVVLDIPVRVAPWVNGNRLLPQGATLLKPIAAMEGDEVCLYGMSLWINGEDWGPILEDLPVWEGSLWRGCEVLEAGEILVASRVVGSVDGRYFGVLPISAARARAVHLFRWD